MKPFMDREFCLENETAKHLFHDYAEHLPIIDYHCHISPREIYEDRRYNNISEVWFGGRNADGTYFGDHYKWRVMRANGVPEEKITGSADPYEKFAAFAEALEMAIGNPMYHWSNLELHKYFGITEPLTVKNAEKIWEKTCHMLQNDPDLSVRGIIRQSGVSYIGTTDDPTDSLEWHEKLAAEKDLGFLVCPSFRPDKAINIQRPGFAEYISRLAEVTGRPGITTVDGIISALYERIDYFKAHGCRASDHGIDYIPYRECTDEEADRILMKAIEGETLSREETEKYQTRILLALARKYAKENIVMEIHFGCSRNVNQKAFEAYGPDTGYDMIAKTFCFNEFAKFCSKLSETDELPKIIDFSLDSTDFNQLASLNAGFQSAKEPGWMQLGAAWWFLDTRDGMEAQMKALANNGLLGNFVGMLTDSRSFLSYSRHDYFRRIACSLIGKWVENGEYPDDEESLKKIVEGICYKNAKRYFRL